MNITLTREQVRRVDELAIHRYGIAGLVLMENAGRNAAAIIDRAYGPNADFFSGGMAKQSAAMPMENMPAFGCTELGHDTQPPELGASSHYGPTERAVIFCGSGNNGGDGCVIARHLHNAAWSVRVVLAGDVSRMTPDASANYRIFEAMGLRPVTVADAATQQAAASSITPQEIVVDALLGTGFSGEVRSPLAELIHAINAARKRAVVAVDLPSGLDCDSGTPGRATIRADLTITFVARKRGFDSPEAAAYLGRIEVAEIGAPHELIAEIVAGHSEE